MRNNRLLTRLGRLQEHLSRGLRELRIVHRLYVKRRYPSQSNQLLRNRWVVAVRVVQIFKAELRRAHHQRKSAQPITLHSHLDHLLWLVVHRVQHQRANPFVVFRFAQCCVRAHVVAPKSQARGIQIRPRSKHIHRRAHFIHFVIAQRANSAVRSVRSKIKNEYVVLVVLQRRFQRQQLAAAGFVSMAQNNRRRSPQPGKEPSFAFFSSARSPRHDELQHFRPPWETRHVDFRARALRLHDAINEKARDGRCGQHGKKRQGQ